MSTKAAIELSMNFLVILIISIVLFGFGVIFISTLSSEATKLQEMTINELDAQLDDILCQGSDRVCIGNDRKQIGRGNFGVFGIKILNVLDDQDFFIDVSRPTPSGYTKNKEDILSDYLFVNPSSRKEFVKKNDERDIAIGIEVPKDAVAGTYIFNVGVKIITGAQYGDYVSVQKLYVEVPNTI